MQLYDRWHKETSGAGYNNTGTYSHIRLSPTELMTHSYIWIMYSRMTIDLLPIDSNRRPILQLIESLATSSSSR
jgi:hypothetical protein